jgi:hypothetical protein
MSNGPCIPSRTSDSFPYWVRSVARVEQRMREAR